MDLVRFIVSLAVIATVGCSDADLPPSSSKGATDEGVSGSTSTPLTVSIGGTSPLSAPADGAVVYGTSLQKTGLSEILAAAESHLAAASAPETAAQDASAHARKAAQIVADVIAETLGDAAARESYHQAITILLKARVQLAVRGGKEDTDALYTDVRILNESKPNSAEAAEGVYHLARFSLTKAQQDTASLRWVAESSKWALEYASRTACVAERAATLLLAVAQRCEGEVTDHQQTRDVGTLNRVKTDCYTVLASQFSETPAGRHAVSAFRRLSLPGTQLSQFAGPTLDGGYVTSAELSGRPVVIYFWSIEGGRVRGDLMTALHECHQIVGTAVRFVGVCLETDESKVRAFVSSEGPPGDQLFFTAENRRGWDSPVARFWGISRSPTVWLVDADGIVRSVDVQPARLTGLVRRLID